MTKHREVIQQSLPILDWPLKNAGDEKFFGYVVSIGVFPLNWENDDGYVPYVDFAYGHRYERYRLPEDDDLRRQLFRYMRDNINQTSCGGMYGKVWITLTKDGYEVDLP